MTKLGSNHATVLPEDAVGGFGANGGQLGGARGGAMGEGGGTMRIGTIDALLMMPDGR